MSQPASGEYYIINREATPDGTTLAITFNGEDQPLTVAEIGSQPTQVWIISDHDSETQIISPENTGTSYQVTYDGNDLTVKPAGTWYWAIRVSDNVCTIQDGGFTKFWQLTEAEVGQKVIVAAGGDTVLQNWQLLLR